MTSVDRVKIICKSRKIPISKLERELGFANGYIGQLKKGTMPAERLAAVAEYLDVSYEYLLNGDAMDPVPPEQSTRGMTEEQREAYYRDLHKKEPPEMIGGLTEEEIEYIRWFREEASEKEKALVRTLIKGEENKGR